jgi:acetolactate synthase I/II/III large subunit
MKLSDYVAEFLVRNRVNTLFLLPGGACMHLCDSIGQRRELTYVTCLHEQACSFAAESFAEYNNGLGVCLVTAGPGSTNAITGVACAWIESASVLFISGQAKRSDLLRERGVRSMGPQEVDIVRMVEPVTKYAVQLLDPRRIKYELEKAVFLATSGRRGPVWIDIPLDVQASEINVSELESYVAEPPAQACELSQAVEKIITTLRKAKRPLFYAGNGVRSSGTVECLRRILAVSRIPTILSWKAADVLPDDHPQYIGRPGAIGQRAANFAQQKCDWILVLGARLDLPAIAFNLGNFAPSAHKIYVDIDPAELRKFVPQPEQSVNVDLEMLLPQLEDRMKALTELDFQQWLLLCRSWVKRFPVVLPEYWITNGYISTYVLIDVLCEAASAEDVIVPGSSGPCSDILMQAWRVRSGQRIFNAPGLGAMGTGVPATIGACLASSRRRVINVNGDGGFQLNSQELETVRRLDLPIKYFVLDNGGYRSIVAMQRNHFNGRLVGSDPTSCLTLPDTFKVAQAYGIWATRVEHPQQLRAAVQEVLSREGPAVCVVKTSPDEVTAPRCTSEVGSDGVVRSKPMEDMWPFLDRMEFQQIMSS